VSDTGSPEPLVNIEVNKVESKDIFYYHIYPRIYEMVTGHNFESILPKDYPCHVCFKLADWFQKRRIYVR
jgi:hypothetical protein